MGTQVLIPGCTGHPFLPRVGIQSLKALSALSSAAALGLCSENFQTILPSSCTNLYSHQRYTRIPFSLHLGEYLIFLVFLVTAILTGVRRDLLVVLPVFPWLAILNTYWSFVRFFFFLRKMSIQALGPFYDRVVWGFSCYWVARIWAYFQSVFHLRSCC